ncbi:MAG TPA: threonine ammonia-lyase, biosynthetic [Verrucomicrobiae bacterium]|nr:threonine ammonia-lyase, biosynthetic [Verrucomicrobiae bacterium]
MKDPLKQTLLARVYDVATESPLQRATKLSTQVGADVYLKREDLQPVHSFKLRGAYNKIASLSPAERAKGVIAASAGNHAQGVALSAQKLGIRALIVMPTTTPSIKVDAVKSYGAQVELVGDSYSDAYDHCMQRVKETGMTFVHPFDDPLVIAGQGTIGRELLEQLPDMTHVFVPVGGGGLIAGVSQFIKGIRPDVKIIGVEPEDSNAMQQSLQAGKVVTLDHVGIFADGVAVKSVGQLTFQITQKYVDQVITVSTDQMCAAIKSLFEDTRSIVEPAGALAAAGVQHYKLPKDAKAVAICSGANVSFERLQQIAERTLIGSGKEALFAVTMPEQAGALHTFCQQVLNGHSITEFNYRLNKREGAHVLVGVSVANEADKLAFMKKMQQDDYEHIDLSGDDIAKEHVRHMVGGPADQAKSERLYQIDFPERPGALGGFLAAVGTAWNISAFHYRNAASDTGNVLIGFEVDNPTKLEDKLSQAGYQWRSVDHSPSLKVFIE